MGDTLLEKAEAEAQAGRYKEAYNVLARGAWQGGPEDQTYRHRRGVYAYEVAHQRLDHLDSSPTPKTTLIKAGCWLARSEAYLQSAAEGADGAERARIEAEVERTRQEGDRFRGLTRALGEDLFVTKGDDVADN